MKKRILCGRAGWLAGVLLCGQLQAAGLLVDHGSYTTDLASGLDWLDLTETRGYSPDSVNSGIAAGVITPGGISLAGWRYATGDEVSLLITGTPDPSSQEIGCVADACLPERSLFGIGSLLGFTRATNGLTAKYVDPLPANPQVGDIYDYDALGFIADIAVPASSIYGSDRLYVAGLDTDSLADGISGYDLYSENRYIFYDYQSVSYVGSFLVRDTLTPVPLPPAALLFVPAILGLLGWRRRVQPA